MTLKFLEPLRCLRRRSSSLDDGIVLLLERTHLLHDAGRQGFQSLDLLLRGRDQLSEVRNVVLERERQVHRIAHLVHLRLQALGRVGGMAQPHVGSALVGGEVLCLLLHGLELRH